MAGPIPPPIVVTAARGGVAKEAIVGGGGEGARPALSCKTSFLSCATCPRSSSFSIHPCSSRTCCRSSAVDNSPSPPSDERRRPKEAVREAVRNTARAELKESARTMVVVGEMAAAEMAAGMAGTAAALAAAAAAEGEGGVEAAGAALERRRADEEE